jgi:hypothetical protein
MAKANEGPLTRILKILNLAESEASRDPKLAEEYRQKAYALAAQATIDAAMIRYAQEHGIGQPQPEGTIHKFLDMGRPFVQQGALANLVYSEFGIKVVKISGYKNRFDLIGFKSDMDRADMMFASLVVQCTREAARGFRNYLDGFDGKPERRPTWVRSFWYGWLSEVALRNRDVAVRDAVAVRYPKLVKVGGRRGSTGSGREAGREAGRRADLGLNKVGATQRSLSK